MLKVFIQIGAESLFYWIGYFLGDFGADPVVKFHDPVRFSLADSSKTNFQIFVHTPKGTQIDPL